MSFDLRHSYEQEAPKVFSFLGRFGLSGADLEDAVHDTFVTALAKARDYDAKRPLAPWLLGIAFRVGVARVRSRRTIDALPVELEDASQDPHRAAEAAQAQRLVQRILTQLPEEQAMVFVLFELQGLGADEISTMMNAPVATTYSRLRLARIAFQRVAETFQQGAAS